MACFVKRGSASGAPEVRIGIGNQIGDTEGRVITLDFPKFSMTNVYTPNSGQNLERLDMRTKTWDKEFLSFIKR